MRNVLVFMFIVSFGVSLLAQGVIYKNCSPGIDNDVAARSAGELLLFHDGEPFVSGSTLTIHGEVPGSEIVAEMAVKNNTSEARDILVSKEIIAEADGHVNVFCWGMCFPPNVFVSPISITLLPGELNEDDFSGHLMHNGYEGTTIIKYTFFEGVNPAVEVHFYAEYIAGGPVLLNPPENLTVAVDENDVNLSWTAPSFGGRNGGYFSDEILSFNIYRDSEIIDNTTATTYDDLGLLAGNYLYQVSAVYEQGESEPTDYVTVLIEGANSKIQGFIRDALSNLNIDEATVTALNTDFGTLSYITPFCSHYSIMLTPGTYDLSCSAPNYETMIVTNLVVLENSNTGYTFYLTPEDGQEVTTGINGFEEKEILVYPNPARETLHINGSDILTLHIFNHHGQVAYQNSTPLINNTINIDGLPPGIYFVQAETSNGLMVEKLVIEK